MALRPDDTTLSIGSFAAATGLSHKALRIYDEMGLLSPSTTDPFTGYRYYGPDQVQRGQLIRQMRDMEMPLGTIRNVLAATPQDAERLLVAYRRSLDDRSAHVSRVSRHLINNLRYKENNMSLIVESRELEPQQIVSLEGHVLVTDLDAFIQDSLQRLATYVAAQEGEVTGSPLGLFHGQINDHDDGPLEVCLPATGAFTATGAIRIRELPGGPAAVAVARDEYTRFPLILQAYDAAHDWISSHGYQPAESPREVWIGNGPEGPFEIVWRYEPK